MAARFGPALICDRVYIDQATNKAVLAGVYAGDIRMRAIPGHLDFSFYVEFHSDDGKSHDIDVQFCLNGNVLGGMKTDVHIVDAGAPSILSSPAIVIPINEAGTIEIRGIIDGGAPAQLVQKTVKVGLPELFTSSSASPPPSSQSPSGASDSGPSPEPRPPSSRGRRRAVKSLKP